MVDSIETGPLNTLIQWNAGTACVSECVLKTLACRGLRVGPSKGIQTAPRVGNYHFEMAGFRAQRLMSPTLFSFKYPSIILPLYIKHLSPQRLQNASDRGRSR